MTLDDELVDLIIELKSDDDIHPEDLDELRRDFYKELKFSDVESVELISIEPAPEGTKSGIPIGAEIAVALLAPMIPETIGYVYRWVKRHEDQKIIIKSTIGGNQVEIVITGKGNSEQQINKFMDSFTNAMSAGTTPQ